MDIAYKSQNYRMITENLKAQTQPCLGDGPTGSYEQRMRLCPVADKRSADGIRGRWDSRLRDFDFRVKNNFIFFK